MQKYVHLLICVFVFAAAQRAKSFLFMWVLWLTQQAQQSNQEFSGYNDEQVIRRIVVILPLDVLFESKKVLLTAK